MRMFQENLGTFQALISSIIITQAIGSYWTSAIKESKENQCLSGLTASNPGGLIAKGMVKKPFPFSFPCLLTRRGTVVL